MLVRPGKAAFNDNNNDTTIIMINNNNNNSDVRAALADPGKAVFNNDDNNNSIIIIIDDNNNSDVRASLADPGKAVFKPAARSRLGPALRATGRHREVRAWLLYMAAFLPCIRTIGSPNLFPELKACLYWKEIKLVCARPVARNGRPLRGAGARRPAGPRPGPRNRANLRASRANIVV